MAVLTAAAAFVSVIAAGFAGAASSSSTGARVSAPSAPRLAGMTRGSSSGPARLLPLARQSSRAGGEVAEPPENLGDLREFAKAGGAAAPQAVPRAPAPAPAFTFEGISSASPGALGVPDTNGDVGPNHYVEIVNKLWAVYSKTGVLLGGPFAENSLWASAAQTPCKTLDRGDPVVLYDELADRWMLSFFAFDAPNNVKAPPYYECIAVSKTGDPLQGWWIYSFNLSSAAGIGNQFPDYPKFGVWPDAYYMSANLFTGNAQDQQDGLLVAFDRQSMLNGLDARFIYYVDTTLSGNALPADLDGAAPPAGSPGYFLVPHPTDYKLRLYRFTVNWAVPGNSTVSNVELPVNAYDYEVCSDGDPIRSQCINQPGTTVKLDPLDHDQLMYRLAYRNFGTHDALFAAQTIDVANDQTKAAGQAGIRWYEIRSPRTTPQVYQQGTFAPDATHRWLPAIAADKFGSIAVGYNVSNATNVFPGIRYAARAATDPLHLLPLSETTLVAGGGSKTESNADGRARWGDYSSMSVDPVDDCTFWFSGEYLTHNSGQAEWNTRIGVFSVPPCVGPPVQPPAPPPPPSPPPPPAPVIRNVTMAMAGPRTHFQRERTFQVGWRNVAPRARYDVQYRSAKFRGIYGRWRSWKSNTSATSASFTGRAGTSYCFRAKANPASGFNSNWTNGRCTAVPVDDWTMRARGGWRFYRPGRTYLRTVSESYRRGATLGLTGVRATRLALVVTKCSYCGSVRVYWNKRLLASLRLTSSSLLFKQIVEIASFPSQQHGTIRIVVASRKKPVWIEGLGVSS